LAHENVFRDRSMPLKILHFPLVFLRRLKRLERPQISSLVRFRVFLPRIQSVTARFESPNHNNPPFRIKITRLSKSPKRKTRRTGILPVSIFVSTRVPAQKNSKTTSFRLILTN
jgi:hypothetical protein